jgi:uncharacterized protein
LRKENRERKRLEAASSLLQEVAVICGRKMPEPRPGSMRRVAGGLGVNRAAALWSRKTCADGASSPTRKSAHFCERFWGICASMLKMKAVPRAPGNYHDASLIVRALMNLPRILLAALAVAAFAVSAQPSTARAEDVPAKLRVLLVTGGHGFEVEPFFKVFTDNPDIAFTPAKHNKDADAYDRDDLLSYDVVVLYDMPKTITEAQKARFLSLFDKGTGVVVLHHALVAYQDWPEYEQIIGGRYPEEKGQAGAVTPEVGYQHDVDIPIVIVAKDHPITAGLADFTIHDEIYWGFRVGADVTPLITTTHPKSGKPLAWTRLQGKSRLVYLQLGHGPSAYDDPNYRRLLAQSIRWVGAGMGQ